MVKTPAPEDELDANKKDETDSGPPSHPTKDSQDREKSGKIMGKFGNEWNSANAGA
jgi:hypothetical protein